MVALNQLNSWVSISKSAFQNPCAYILLLSQIQSFLNISKLTVPRDVMLFQCMTAVRL